MPWQHLLKQGHRPLLECFRRKRVIGVAESGLRNVPGLLPFQIFFVYQDAHQFRHGQCGMGIVELYGHFGREPAEGLVVPLKFPDNVPRRAGHEEIFLDETQFPARDHGVRRIEHLRYRLGGDLLLHGPEIVSAVEDLHVEVVGRSRGIEPQQIDGSSAVSGDQHVVGNTYQHLPVHPHWVIGVPSGRWSALCARKRARNTYRPDAGSPRGCFARASFPASHAGIHCLFPA
jgi:hypothetical protein